MIQTTSKFLLAGLVLLLACAKQETEDIDLLFAYEYFPLEIGQERVYQLDSIIFDPIPGGIGVDTFSWQLRERIVDTLRSSSGTLRYLIERAERANDTLPWVTQAIWTASRTQTQAFRTEDNLRFVKMNFPLREGDSWDANIFIDKDLKVEIAGEQVEIFKGWESEILNLSENVELEGQNFENVLSIQIADNENLIEYRYGLEQYAADIGLIYKELWVLDTQCEFCCNNDFELCDNLEWEQKAEAGFILRQQLLD